MRSNLRTTVLVNSKESCTMAVAAPARPLTETNALRMPLPAAPARRAPALRARPIAVAAYPAGTPRWVTYAGRRHRVVAVHDQPALDPALVPAPAHARRL